MRVFKTEHMQGASLIMMCAELGTLLELLPLIMVAFNTAVFPDDSYAEVPDLLMLHHQQLISLTSQTLGISLAASGFTRLHSFVSSRIMVAKHHLMAVAIQRFDRRCEGLPAPREKEVRELFQKQAFQFIQATTEWENTPWWIRSLLRQEDFQWSGSSHTASISWQGAGKALGLGFLTAISVEAIRFVTMAPIYLDFLRDQFALPPNLPTFRFAIGITSPLQDMFIYPAATAIVLKLAHAAVYRYTGRPTDILPPTVINMIGSISMLTGGPALAWKILRSNALGFILQPSRTDVRMVSNVDIADIADTLKNRGWYYLKSGQVDPLETALKQYEGLDRAVLKRIIEKLNSRMILEESEKAVISKTSITGLLHVAKIEQSNRNMAFFGFMFLNMIQSASDALSLVFGTETGASGSSEEQKVQMFLDRGYPSAEQELQLRNAVIDNSIFALVQTDVVVHRRPFEPPFQESQGLSEHKEPSHTEEGVQFIWWALQRGFLPRWAFDMTYLDEVTRKHYSEFKQEWPNMRYLYESYIQRMNDSYFRWSFSKWFRARVEIQTWPNVSIEDVNDYLIMRAAAHPKTYAWFQREVESTRKGPIIEEVEEVAASPPTAVPLRVAEPLRATAEPVRVAQTARVAETAKAVEPAKQTWKIVIEKMWKDLSNEESVHMALLYILAYSGRNVANTNDTNTEKLFKSGEQENLWRREGKTIISDILEEWMIVISRGEKLSRETTTSILKFMERSVVPKDRNKVLDKFLNKTLPRIPVKA